MKKVLGTVAYVILGITIHALWEAKVVGLHENNPVDWLFASVQLSRIIVVLLILITVGATIYAWRWGRQIIIYKASYGGRDVTDRVNEQVKSGTNEIPVTNDTMGGDPMPLIPKTLTIEYYAPGRRRKIEVQEGGTAKLE